MTRTRKVCLIQAENDDKLYIVDKLTNTLSPAVGTVLKESEAEQLIRSRLYEVTITRAKRS